MFAISERRKRLSVAELVPVLARRILADVEPQERLPTVRGLASQLHSSPASIHAAVARLEEAGAIGVETRGRSGAFLVAKSTGRLWALAQGSPLVIALPLASSPRYEALATAIKHLLTSTGFEVFLIFVRGSRQRLEAVHAGRSHLTVMSRFAADELDVPEDAIVAELHPRSYNTGHRVFYVGDRADATPLRLIVDRYSADQQLLTNLEFDGRNVTHVPAMTAQIARLLQEGWADAAVWTVDEMETRRPAGVLDRPLSASTLERIGDRDTRAVLVGVAGQARILRRVTAALDPNDVERVQLDVMAGRTVPEY
jgi:hypothetical protein